MPIRNKFPGDKFHIIGSEETQKKLKEKISELEEIRNEIIEAIPSKENNINTARVEIFSKT